MGRGNNALLSLRCSGARLRQTFGKLKGPAYLGKEAASELAERNQPAAQSGEGLGLVFEELGGFR